MCKTNRIKNYNIFFFIIVCIIYVLIVSYHEPWFDEAQAWQIAKCASYKDIIFEIPHYEGHPPFWYLLLSIPAKIGVPFELGLKSIGFLIFAINIYLILFRLKLPPVIRFSLPFSYFIFYQNGIIVRPYSILFTVLLLCAINFNSRLNNPKKFYILLGLMCCTSGYGIVIAGGFAFCIIIEVLTLKDTPENLKILRKKIGFCSSLLLVWAVLIILLIAKRSDTYVASEVAVNPLWKRLIVSLLCYLPDNFITTSSWFAKQTDLLQNSTILTSNLLSLSFIGLIIWIAIYLFSSGKLFLYFLIPYLFFAVFGAVVHMGAHHIGIVTMLLVPWLSVVYSSTDRFNNWKRIKEKIQLPQKDIKILKYAVTIIGISCLLIPVYWNVRSCYCEICEEYSYGRGTANFLKEHGLDQLVIMASWNDAINCSSDPSDTQTVINTNDVGIPTAILAYYDRNIVKNFNLGSDDAGYYKYRYSTDEENEKFFENCRECGLPDVLLGKADFEDIIDGFNIDDYAIVYSMDLNYIWKGSVKKSTSYLYVRRNLLEKYNLSEVDISGSWMYNEIKITKEMVEAYQRGELKIEDILPF